MSRIRAARRVVSLGGVVVGLMLLGAGSVGRAADVKRVDMLDRCDPESFNAMFGAGICVEDHQGVNVGTFLSVLERAQTMGAWHFAPGAVMLKEGQAFQPHNSGGELHTFTEVDEFGGGFIPELNALTGDVVPAPECLNIPALEFIPPGASSDPEVESKGTHLYQCCIHPWMRATVTVK